MMTPYNLNMEQGVLGGCILESGAMEQVSFILDERSFYMPENQIIWKALMKLKKRGDRIDLLMLTQELIKTNELDQAGGAYEIAKLSNKVSSSANIEYHARVLQQYKAQREAIRIGQELTMRGYDVEKDGIGTLTWAQTQLQEISSGILKRNAVTYAEAWHRAAKTLNTPRVAGVKTGFTELDKKGGTLEPGDLTILAARPGMGKTILGLDIALNVAQNGQACAFFSLEMPEEQLTNRIISRKTGIALARIRSRELNSDEWVKILDNPVPELPLWIDDTAQLTPLELEGKIANIKAKHGMTLAVVDYLQIMKGNGEKYMNREAEVSSISRDLKAIAKRQKIHIIALAQINREADKRSKPEPKLADLRESGSIEQDADNVWFIYRPEYYSDEKVDDRATLEIGSTGINVPLKGHATIICEKFRNGPKFRAYLRCNLAQMKFMNGPVGYGKERLVFDHNNYPEIIEAH